MTTGSVKAPAYLASRQDIVDWVRVRILLVTVAREPCLTSRRKLRETEPGLAPPRAGR